MTPCASPAPDPRRPASLRFLLRRCRPGDPFIEQQQEEQAELAALAAEAQPVTAPRPAALLAPAPTFGSGPPGGAIPGIGDAVAMPVLPAATVDVFGTRQQQPYDAERRGGQAPADGPAAAGGASQQRPGGDGEGTRCVVCVCSGF